MPHYDEIKNLVSIITAMREPFDHHGGHVAGYAMSLAKALNLPVEQVELITWGAHLHDIGKILVRRELLNSTRKYAEAERAEVRTHVMLGWAVVSEAGYDDVIQGIVRHHHERWDGKGYPDGLVADQIPLGARIVSICDCYEALTSKRTYREAYSHNFAMAFIQKDKGTHYDPELVDVFFEKVKF
jgi:putative nucleotidyltransferase with HDIG domain